MFSEQLIFLDVECASKEQAVRFLCEKLAQCGKVSDAGAFMAEVMDRERTDSTAVGNGLAIPHGICQNTAGVAAAVVKLKSPVVWDAQHSVRWIILIAVSALEKPGGYLEQVGRLARLLLAGDFSGRLEAVQTKTQVLELLSPHE